MMKRRILERINHLDEKDMARFMKETQDNNNTIGGGAGVGESVKAQTINNEDKASIIT